MDFLLGEGGTMARMRLRARPNPTGFLPPSIVPRGTFSPQLAMCIAISIQAPVRRPSLKWTHQKARQ
jgi:hypothetical protein